MTSFQKAILPLSILQVVSVFLTSCETTSSNNFEPVMVEGVVVDSGDNPINDAVVRIVEPRPERFTVTNSNGEYSFEIDVDSTITVTIVASKEGFETKSQNFVAIPERNVTLPNFQLRSLTEDPITDDPDDPTDPTDPVDPDAPLAEAASIYLEEMTANEIGVRGTGQREDTKITFQIVDLNGNPLREGNKVDVNFRFGNRPDGGEMLTTETATSNNSGQVTATLLSGTASGTVQVMAEFTR
ncbi:MAG: carboxypeptidase regulatory-like domain-containing protein, partial [Balneolales bacterium]|nr:carboxypeptidase regulatory-like domain-containing protein [Balneolales bacterium]